MSKKLIITSEKYKNLFDSSNVLSGFELIFIPENPNVDRRLSGHTDLSIFKLSNTKLIAKGYLKGSAVVEKLESLGIEIIFDNSFQGPEYPDDCGLNAAILGNSLVCSKKAASGILISECTKAGYNNIYVNQGYVKCSLCSVTDTVAITSDPGIFKKLSSIGYDILLINPDSIRLDGFDHGFFGGCAFMKGGNTLCLTGILPDTEAAKINSFLGKFGIKTENLSDGIISDIGGCIVINI